MKRVLITGANSYIGNAFSSWVKKKHNQDFAIEILDMMNSNWMYFDFQKYDAVFHVAGIAHADVEKVSEKQKELYYKVNRDLAIAVACKSKESGVRQFILMSSMIVYGESASLGKSKLITKETKPSPSNFYGDSKLQADIAVRKLAGQNFNVAVIRPPMIYGANSKGNYSTIVKLAKKLPFFPDIENERSAIYINNFCEFVTILINRGVGGVFFPQNREYICTSDLLSEIAKVHQHKVILTKMLNPAIFILDHTPIKYSKLVRKAFGNIVYDKSLSAFEMGYNVYSFEESIIESEGEV